MALYGLLSGLMYQKLHLGAHVSLVVAMVGGRIAYGLLGYLVLPLLGVEKVLMWAPLVSAVTRSLPGVVVQLVLIPLILATCERDWGVLFPEKKVMTVGGRSRG